jgi:hypothetical protein
LLEKPSERNLIRSKQVTAGESGKIHDGLNAFVKGAGLGGWNGTVHNDVTTVFMGMLCAAGKKTKALHWVPRPSYNPSLA